MSAAKHTPGPWVSSFAKWQGYRLEIRPAAKAKGWTSGFAPIARVVGDKRVASDLQRQADLRLIAAAPELLEALEILTDCLENSIELLSHDPADDARVKLARAVIAKATGAAA